MKTNLVVIGIIAIVLIAGGIGFYIVNQYATAPESLPGETPETEQPETTPPETTPPASEGAQTYNIEIKNFAFSPSELTINVGDTVIWTNRKGFLIQ